MSVSITFEPSGISGVVAQGTYIIDAARRMGAPLGTGCTAGKGDCPSCVVSITTGAELLSPPSVAEEKQLGVELLEQALRLACQVKIQNHGEVVVLVTARPQTHAAQSNDQSELRKKFGALPLGKKIATLVQFEAITASEAFDSAMEKPLAYGSKAFDSIMNRARATRAKNESKK
ncbi:MAG TPA: 2Fe-2S iron-sulfur cluster-binding protein [Pyrinomonadaceae bacterium]|nr:2Fe-2S iron-sulfur cluster-binding protein [Pyrinomonadaceae bacterium]